jgi:hypothetical protein
MVVRNPPYNVSRSDVVIQISPSRNDNMAMTGWMGIRAGVVVTSMIPVIAFINGGTSTSRLHTRGVGWS